MHACDAVRASVLARGRTQRMFNGMPLKHITPIGQRLASLLTVLGNNLLMRAPCLIASRPKQPRLSQPLEYNAKMVTCHVCR